MVANEGENKGSGEVKTRMIPKELQNKADCESVQKSTLNYCE